MVIARITSTPILIDGTDLTLAAVDVFSDVTDRLSESMTFFGILAESADTNADWTTYFSVLMGARIAASGNWDIYLQPLYGSPHDPDEKPYYTRLTITATMADGTLIDIDSVSSPEIIGHGQAIPPTAIVWNPTTQVVVSSVEGHTLAFSQTLRIKSDPNATGFGHDGEFVIRYDHTIESEGQSIFYVAASWPCQFMASNGKFLRADIPDLGHQHGFTLEERGPYIEWDDYAGGATNYPITHINFETRNIKDEREWDNSWQNIGYSQRSDSGIGPLCGNIASRGADYLRDFGMAWLVKSLATRVLTQYPSPVNPHARNESTYNYEDDAMRGKGRTVWTMAVLYRALNLMVSVRDTAVDTEVIDLRDALGVRVIEILDVLKLDFANDSWRTYQNDNTWGQGLPYWEAGHYWQGLLVYQEVVSDLLGSLDADVDSMMRVIAAEIHVNTLLWTNGAAHPRDSSITYNGGFTGYNVEFLKFTNTSNAGRSVPSTGIGPVLVAVYEWAKDNGLDTGSKQDAIISQYSGVDYKWHYAGGTSPKLFGSLAATMSFTAATGTSKTNYNAALAATMNFTASVTPTISGGGKIRKGSILSVSSTSVGSILSIGPGASTTLGTFTFEVTRADDFKQPFQITLDQSRALDGNESWRFTVRKTKDADVVLAMSKGSGISIGTVNAIVNCPTLTFIPADFALFPDDEDGTYLYDLEMSKDGKFETLVIDNLEYVADISR